ncbi:MAG: hypothetical protein MUP24_10085, partial [Gillisia sp.]|nr:hypothetical protein [Gillisia sp.]
NSAIAMTGAQDSSATGRLVDICRGFGVEEEHLRVLTPLNKNFQENLDFVRQEINYQGVSVIISERPCVQLPNDKKDKLNELKKASIK